ncbi:hypothetical protein ACVWW6_008860 [Bradyrhizobium sp. USDA 3311]|nr:MULTISPECIES: hypothetical protein [unclassified Bradyrhizobium]
MAHLANKCRNRLAEGAVAIHQVMNCADDVIDRPTAGRSGAGNFENVPGYCACSGRSGFGAAADVPDGGILFIKNADDRCSRFANSIDDVEYSPDSGHGGIRFGLNRYDLCGDLLSSILGLTC